MERERRERIKTHVSMRESVVSKVVKKWLYKYHFSNMKILLSRYIPIEKSYLYNHFLTTFEPTLSLILTCVFILSLLFSLSIVFVQSQEEKSSCHQNCLILVVHSDQNCVRVTWNKHLPVFT